MNPDERAEPHSFCFMREEREDFPQGNTVCSSITFTSSVLSLPRKREGLFMCPTEQLMCNGDVRSRRPVGMVAIWKQAACSCQASAHPGYSFGAHIEHPPGRAHNDSLVLKPITKAGFHPLEHSGQQCLLTPILRNLPALGLKCSGQARGYANWPSIHPVSIYRGTSSFQGFKDAKVNKI